MNQGENGHMPLEADKTLEEFSLILNEATKTIQIDEGELYRLIDSQKDKARKEGGTKGWFVALPVKKDTPHFDERELNKLLKRSESRFRSIRMDMEAKLGDLLTKQDEVRSRLRRAEEKVNRLSDELQRSDAECQKVMREKKEAEEDKIAMFRAIQRAVNTHGREYDITADPLLNELFEDYDLEVCWDFDGNERYFDPPLFTGEAQFAGVTMPALLRTIEGQTQVILTGKYKKLVQQTT
jgi:hypothetical protein